MRSLTDLHAPFAAMRATNAPVPCRPGLRRGAAPIRREPAASRGALDRFASRVLLRTGAGRFETRARRRAEGIASRIPALASLGTAELDEKFGRLSASLRLKGHDEGTLDEALAHAALAAGRFLGLVPREGQCVAALALLHGRFVEMPTGEGKTLTVALAAAVAALDGTPVHVLTANDYLAERDAARLAPLYAALGLSGGCVLPTMDDAARRATYARDIVHVTGKQVAFDWLRDARTGGPEASGLSARLGPLTRPDIEVSMPAPLLRGLCLAIVDEADSLLIDEARTPLVLAVERGGTETAALDTELGVALGLAQLLHEGDDFRIERTRRSIELTPQGERALARLAERVPGTWQAARYRDERVRQALTALHLLRRDRDYIVRDGKVELIDEQNGRTLPGRRLQHGLQRLLELKERCATTPESDVVASIPFQRFCARYLRLVGTSGTLHEVRAELAHVYGASLVRVAHERPSRLRRWPSRVLATRGEQLDALIEDVRRCRAAGRPVLVGTRSVEQSSGVGAMLAAYGIPHRVLNASQDRDEAAIIADAGAAGHVTVATNMAGRGTDIPLGESVARNGGLHVVSLAFNEARRIDRQLAGRAARQGEPGSYRRIACLDDPDLVAALPGAVLAFARRSLGAPSLLAALLPIRLAQWRIERRHARERRAALDSRKRLAHHVAIGGQLDSPT